MNTEQENKMLLASLIKSDFELFSEVWVRHPLFRNRRMRVDIVAVPRDEAMADIAFAFELKKDVDALDVSWAKHLKQGADYVLSTIEPDATRPILTKHFGKRVMATFMFPGGPSNTWHYSSDPKDAWLAGMSHMASTFRVGTVQYSGYNGNPIALYCPNEVWVSGRGWRHDARNILVGKRQIGSQRFSILDELAGISGTDDK